MINRLALLALLLVACGGPSPAAPVASTTRTSPVVAGDPCHSGAVTYCVLNPDVTQGTIATTICTAGWTATIRPPSTYTSDLKRQQIAAEGFADTNPADYEEDHRLPLELGGAPRDPFNLSPEAHPGSFTKDTGENAAKQRVCSGLSSLRVEQAAFVAKWLGVYPLYRSLESGA